MMHGFGILAAIRRGGHLHAEALNLRRHGIRAYAPNVAPYHNVATRAAMWKRRIEHILEETGASHVTLVAQSMGGLDARYLISRLGMHRHVAALVTVSTPHRGSPVAIRMLEQPAQVRTAITTLCNWLGQGCVDGCGSDYLAAVSELTPEYLRHHFNPATTDHPDVRYWSYAGRAGLGTDVPINPFLRSLNRYIYEREGENDGYVSVSSARWGTFLGTIDADHAREIGISPLPRGDFDASAFYLHVARMLAAEGL